MTKTAPWQWRADLEPWLDGLARAADQWKPTVELACNGGPVSVIKTAVEAAEPWAYHPCLSAITHRYAGGREEREVALVAWLAARAGLEGVVVLTRPVWCWSTTGGILLNEGTHSLDALKAAVEPDAPAPEIPVDPWCAILGYPYPDSIPASGRPGSEQEDAVRDSALVALRAEALLRAYLPEVADWLGSLAKVLVLLDASENLSRSASASDLPGLVFADARSEVAVLEVLVHEAAHNLLYLSEAAGPLVEPSETRRFASPLRPDPRPLRGILLAYHALAFMCAFYKDLEHSAIGADAVDPGDVAGLRSKMSDAGDTINSAVGSFTERGRGFVEATRAVAAYAA